MTDKKSSLSFKQEYEQRAEIKKINECSWFGIVTGLIFLTTGIYQTLCTTGFLNLIFIIMTALGSALLFIGSFFPLVLKNIVRYANKAFSAIGAIVIKILLIPIYMVMTLINIFNRKRYSKKFSFYKWNETDKITSSFSDYDASEHQKSKYAIIDIISNVFSYFIGNRMFILLPVIVVLMILGMILFFASSSAVFSFVYTLF